MVAYIESVEDFERITNGDKPVIIDFTAEWCGPCKIIGPIFEGFSKREDFAGVEFWKVDVDKAAAIAQKCEIRAMPTFKVYKKGQEVEMIRGANPPALEALVQNAASQA